ncbi:Crp/Fnr family transcriptional regulator [Sphingomonas sp.]|uniref:Crp/Fnr family transcriptional regulator n=1 Tax=Sphingomonas sp. TaxID=28214 RepID=UPI0025F7B6BB|nr:Crp/Fnr family transcriptional regulator [Sphingomonas sp.]
MSVMVIAKFRNELLSRLTPADLNLFSAELVPIVFEKRDLLIPAGKTIQRTYFLETGIASVVATTPDGTQTEVGIIGREGMIDVATVMGSETAPLEIFVQGPGHGHSLPCTAFQEALAKSDTLRAVMLTFAQAFMVQVSHTALAAASLSIKARLARWLLMCADRTDGVQIPMTHEFLSLMLSVRRPGVTEAVQAVEATGAIRAHRGMIEIRDRSILKQIAGEGYGAPEAYAAKLSG